MPLYEYQCRACGTRFEKIQKFSDPLLRTCEKCGGALERLLSAPAIQFKGSGWYVTDYARKPGGEGGDSKAEKPAAADAKKSSEPTPANKSTDSKKTKA